jgi:hypothetical protein
MAARAGLDAVNEKNILPLLGIEPDSTFVKPVT